MLLNLENGDDGRVHSAKLWPQPSPIDRPTGRADYAHSAVSGQTLTYFTPDGLGDLLLRCGQRANTSRVELPDDASHRDAALVLVRAIARRGRPKQVDIPQAQRLSQIILGGLKPQSVNDLVALAGSISARNKAIREQIVFSVGNQPHGNQFVFAPYSEVPALVDDLVQVIRTFDVDIDPAVGAAVAGYYALHAHPFLDGNGRWSRLVAAHVGSRLGSPLIATLAVAFLSACKDDLVREVWPNTRAFGLRRFLTASLQFERLLLGHMTEANLFQDTHNITYLLRKAMRSRTSGDSVLRVLYSTGEISLVALRSAGSLSVRAADGLIEQIVAGSEGNAIYDRSCLKVEPLLAAVDRAIYLSKTQLFESGNSYAI